MNTRPIKPGMLVELRLHPTSGRPRDIRIAAKYTGHIGKVLRKAAGYYQGIPRWEVEGADPENLCFPENQLYPIDEPGEPLQRAHTDHTPCEPEWLEDLKRALTPTKAPIE